MTENETLAAARNGSKVRTNVTLHLLWLKDNAFYKRGRIGGEVARIENGIYAIPDNAHNGWHRFVEGVDFVKVKREVTETVVETFTLA